MENRDNTPCFVGLCATCRKLLACSVDEPDRAKDNAKGIASWVRDGLVLEKRTVAEVRAADWCGCKRERKKSKAKSGAAA